MSSIKMRSSSSDIRDYLGQTMLIGNGINTFIGHRDHPKGQTIIRGVNRPKWQNLSTTIDIATTDQITTVEANPENPTQTLSSIKIGDIDYSVGGGASNIPAPPSADGEYNLHCSIVNGVPTYTWKAEQQ